MKKAIVLLAIGFAFTYCNPSQQADQTTSDSARMMDTSAMPATTGTDTGGTGNMPDTTSPNSPDSTHR